MKCQTLKKQQRLLVKSNQKEKQILLELTDVKEVDQKRSGAWRKVFVPIKCNGCDKIFINRKYKNPKYCSKICWRNAVSGKNSPRWKENLKIDANGYIMIRLPINHPIYHKNHRYGFEHRLNMEKHLGRYLNYDEHVHHINGIKSDNRIENLEIIYQQPHAKKHAITSKENKLMRVFLERIIKEEVTLELKNKIELFLSSY